MKSKNLFRFTVVVAISLLFNTVTFSQPTIYSSDSQIQTDRTVDLKNNFLIFQDYIKTRFELFPFNFYGHADSFSSVKTVRDYFQEPNIMSWGMFNIKDPESGLSLTQGMYERATWIQSSVGSTREFKPENYPLLINPLQGNVGIGVMVPTAQLHTINSVRFENLANGEKPENLLGTDHDGNVYEYDPNMFAGGSNGWNIMGNSGTNSSTNFLGTIDAQDLVIKTGNFERFRFTNSTSGRIIVNNQPGFNYDKNFYIGGGNNSVATSTIDGLVLAGNTAIGYGTLINVQKGVANTALGTSALGHMVSGGYNTAVGINALLSNVGGSGNIAMGHNALASSAATIKDTSNDNTALGDNSLVSLLSGSTNVAIGAFSGFNLLHGEGNILIGAVNTPTYISSGNTVTTASNEMNIGNRIYGVNGNIGINVVQPAARLHTNGSLQFDGLNPNYINTKLLTINASNQVETRDFSTFNITSENIYNSSSSLLGDRIVAMDSHPLQFNFGADPTLLSLSGVTVNPINTTANFSVLVNRSDAPNLTGLGHSRIARQTSGSFLTTGYNQNYFWTQSSNTSVAGDYMMNPLGGKVAIGTVNVGVTLACPDCDQYRLFVAQGIRTEKVRVDIAALRGWADFVFDEGYKLMPLEELDKYIAYNKHLPNIPKAEEVVKSGIDLGEMNSKLLEKVEELTLHAIELNRSNEVLKKEVAGQKAILEELLLKMQNLEDKSNNK